MGSIHSKSSVLSWIPIHSAIAGTLGGLDSFITVGALFWDDSFDHRGTLRWGDSFLTFGTLYSINSFIPRGTLNRHDSFLALGTLR
jgi:hypothetical protein